MILRAVSWSVVSVVFNICAQIAITATLSRLLVAEDFGLYASAGLAMRFVTYFSQMGMGPAVIQRSVLGPNTRKTALFAATAIGATAWAVLSMLATPAAFFFRDDRLVELVPVVGLSLFLGGMSAVPRALLRREMNFRCLAINDVAALIFGYGIVSVICAVQGFGVWSLIAGVLAQELILLLGSVVFVKGLWSGEISRAELNLLWGYGSRHSLVGFLDFLSSNVETLFIGRVLGATRLGVFNRAQAITGLPVEQIMSAVGRVVFPVFARARAIPERLGAGYLVALQGNLLFAMPIGVGMAAASTELVTVVLGPGWNDAISVAAIAAFAIPCIHVSTVSGILMDATGAFRKKTVLIVAVLASKLALMAAFASSYGLPGIALALLIGEFVRATLSLYFAVQITAISWLSVLKVLMRAFLVAFPVWLVITVMSRLFSATGQISLLLAEIGVAALLFVFLGRLQLIRALSAPEVVSVREELAGLRRVLRAA